MVATTVAAVRGDHNLTGAWMAAWHVTGLGVGAIALTLLASAVGASLPDLGATPATVVGALCLAVGIAGALGASLPVVSSPAQVPKAWSLTMSPLQHSFAYGVGLGFGVLTRIPSWSLHALLALLILVGDPRVALVAAPIYALGRALPVIAAAGRDDPAPIVVDAIERLRALAFRIDGLVLVLIGVVLATRTT